MSPKKTETTAVATVNPATDLALPDDLAQELGELNALGELDKDDRPLPIKAYNMKMKDDEGEWVPKDSFFDTSTEEIVESIDGVLLTIKKTRRNSIYIEGQGSEILCRSDDMKTGFDQDGKEIECASCHKKNWRRNEKPECSLVYNFIGVDQATGQPFLVRAKGTSLAPARRYIAKFFTSKLKLKNGQYADLPLFVFKTRLSLEKPDGTYAVLKMENLGQCSNEEILQYKALYETFREFRKVDLDSDQPADPSADDSNSDDDDLPDFLED